MAGVNVLILNFLNLGLIILLIIFVYDFNVAGVKFF